jgi:hypothetical protein
VKKQLTNVSVPLLFHPVLTGDASASSSIAVTSTHPGDEPRHAPQPPAGWDLYWFGMRRIQLTDGRFEHGREETCSHGVVLAAAPPQPS